MRWINKKRGYFKQMGHHLVDSFLKEAWNEDVSSYINCTFDNYRREGKITEILLQEQHYYCCYCMRKIGVSKVNGKTTLEHIIPFKASKNEFDNYLKKVPNYFIKNVTWEREEVISKEIKEIITPPYPHILAYENIVASCDGSIGSPTEEYFGNLHNTCNNFRGKKEIIPIFLFKKVFKQIKYTKDGKIIYSEKYQETIEALNLNYPTLVLIRKSWFEISRYHKPLEVRNAIRDNKLRNGIMIDTALSESEKETFVKSDMMWNLLSQYDWFYKYYRKHYK